MRVQLETSARAGENECQLLRGIIQQQKNIGTIRTSRNGLDAQSASAEVLVASHEIILQPVREPFGAGWRSTIPIPRALRRI